MQPAPSPWIFILTRAAVLAIPVFAALRPVTDADVWWHLRVGEWIAEHGWVTTTDPFSSYGADRPWVAYSWLFEIVLFSLYARLGLTGIVVFRVVMAIAVVVALQRLADRCAKHFAAASMLGLVAAVAVFPLMSERPWLFTILFSTLTLEVVLDVREGTRRWTFWALPLVYAVWANVHIQFVYGFLLHGLGCAAPILDGILRLDPPPQGSWRRLVGLTAACVAATLLNPYHVRIYVVVFEYATQPGPFRVVEELMAFTFREYSHWLALALALLTAFALGRRPLRSSFEPLLFALAVILCFRARRDLWLVVLSAIVILPGVIPARTEPQPSRRREWCVAVVIALLLAVFLGRQRGLTEEKLQAEEREALPERAAKVLQALDEPGPLYNDFNWGGYLIWKAPRHRVSMDGRTNLHGEERIQRSLDTWAGRPGWDSDEELTRAGIVFADVGMPLTTLLRRDERFQKQFRIVHEDDQAVIFVRKR